MKTIKNSTNPIKNTTEDKLTFFENKVAQQEQKIDVNATLKMVLPHFW